MPWRDRLRPASFRGVPFKVDTDDFAGGRKTATHEYPQSDVQFVEDLGRRGRGFSIDGYVLGPNFDQARDALITALEDDGPGLLVHPRYGERVVQVVSFRVRHARDEGGIVRFGIEFQETVEESPRPTVATNVADAVGQAADAAREAAFAGFLDVFSVDGLPQFAVDSAAAVVQDAVEAMNAALVPIVTATDDAARLKNDLDELFLDADSLVRDPLTMVSRLRDTVAAIAEAPAVPSRKLDALMVAYGFSAPPAPPATTTTRQTEAANHAAVSGLMRQLSVIEAARAAVDVEFATHEDAVAARDNVADALDAEAEQTTDDDTFRTLAALRSALVLAVPNDARSLSRLATYTPPVTLPALAIAFDLYGDATREAEIVARNRIRHPGFVPGGVPLEVLTDAEG